VEVRPRRRRALLDLVSPRHRERVAELLLRRVELEEVVVLHRRAVHVVDLLGRLALLRVSGRGREENEHEEDAPHCCCEVMMNSTRRFWLRPCSVRLSAIGAVLPKPLASIRSGAMPRPMRYARTLSARFCDRFRL